MKKLAFLCALGFKHVWRRKKGEAKKHCARCGAVREIKRRKA